MVTEASLQDKGIPRLNKYPGAFTGRIESCKQFEGTGLEDRLFFVVDFPKLQITINDMRRILHGGVFIASMFHLFFISGLRRATQTR
jgi:hypothetical protein